jgi:hypothetical protein
VSHRAPVFVRAISAESAAGNAQSPPEFAWSGCQPEWGDGVPRRKSSLRNMQKTREKPGFLRSPEFETHGASPSAARRRVTARILITNRSADITGIVFQRAECVRERSRL